MELFASKIQEHLTYLYGEQTGRKAWEELRARLEIFRERHPGLHARAAPPEERLTEQDALLITYGDQFRSADQAPLRTLAEFLETHVQDALSGVHILPFFPYSSDDGFSVIDFRQVDPALGSWDDVARIARHFRLMIDGVINHISRDSDWFQAFVAGDPTYEGYFITVDPRTDLSQVVRPRSLPLLTPVHTASGKKYVWTTFSEDQIDLNYQNPRVLLEIIDLLLFYVAHGAEFLRLDAIAYLWKDPGTTCIHLEETHRIVKILRAVFELVAPSTILITETNVPHEENISYFGDPIPGREQHDEAQMVYQFPLAPLVLHSFLTGDARTLRDWAASLRTPSPETTFFNFIASHDGIGVMPARGLLDPGAIERLVERTLEHGGQVSYRSNPDGSRSVYELNTTLYDALNDPKHPTLDRDVRRFLASQAIMLSLAGVPGIYVHSLFGTSNCLTCGEATGRARSLNREKFRLSELEAELNDPNTRASLVFSGYLHLLRQRAAQPAFHPAGEQDVLRTPPAVFGLIRRPPDGDPPVLCLINVGDEPVRFELALSADFPTSHSVRDLLTGADFPVRAGTLPLALAPYQYCWLVPR